MKKLFQSSFFLLAILSISYKSLCQCKCNIPPRSISKPEFDNYAKNYEDTFRKGVDVKHSICVDFSSQSIIDFYDSNFSGGGKDDWGVDIYFVSLNKTKRHGQKHPNQLALVLVGSNELCKSQFEKLMIGNNTFDQSKNNYLKPKGQRWYTKGILDVQRDRYKAKFTGDDHTLSIRFPLKSFRIFVEALKQSPDLYDGLRFTFASYNKPGVACNQLTEKQITVLISPILKDGSIDIQQFYNYLKDRLHLTDKDLQALLDTLNHGSLCPNYCPNE